MKYSMLIFILVLFVSCLSCNKSDKLKVGFLSWNNANAYALQNLTGKWGDQGDNIGVYCYNNESETGFLDVDWFHYEFQNK
jgi:hypothetical protein